MADDATEARFAELVAKSNLLREENDALRAALGAERDHASSVRECVAQANIAARDVQELEKRESELKIRENALGESRKKLAAETVALRKEKQAQKKREADVRTEVEEEWAGRIRELRREAAEAKEEVAQLRLDAQRHRSEADDARAAAARQEADANRALAQLQAMEGELADERQQRRQAEAARDEARAEQQAAPTSTAAAATLQAADAAQVAHVAAAACTVIADAAMIAVTGAMEAAEAFAQGAAAAAERVPQGDEHDAVAAQLETLRRVSRLANEEVQQLHAEREEMKGAEKREKDARAELAKSRKHAAELEAAVRAAVADKELYKAELKKLKTGGAAKPLRASTVAPTRTAVRSKEAASAFARSVSATPALNDAASRLQIKSLRARIAELEDELQRTAASLHKADVAASEQTTLVASVRCALATVSAEHAGCAAACEKAEADARDARLEASQARARETEARNEHRLLHEQHSRTRRVLQKLKAESTVPSAAASPPTDTISDSDDQQAAAAPRVAPPQWDRPWRRQPASAAPEQRKSAIQALAEQLLEAHAAADRVLSDAAPSLNADGFIGDACRWVDEVATLAMDHTAAVEAVWMDCVTASPPRARSSEPTADEAASPERLRSLSASLQQVHAQLTAAARAHEERAAAFRRQRHQARAAHRQRERELDEREARLAALVDDASASPSRDVAPAAPAPAAPAPAASDVAPDAPATAPDDDRQNVEASDANTDGSPPDGAATAAG